jgi:hypothetical protein
MKAVDNGDGSQRLEIAGMVFKDVENRAWKTDFRGRIYVHAGKQRVKYDDALIKYLTDRGCSIYWSLMLYGKNLAPTGAIIGAIDIIGCVKDSKSVWAEAGMNHLLLANPEFYEEPIPYKGQLGLFKVLEGIKCYEQLG